VKSQRHVDIFNTATSEPLMRVPVSPPSLLLFNRRRISREQPPLPE
jgi:hypothetical protein